MMVEISTTTMPPASTAPSFHNCMGCWSGSEPMKSSVWRITA
jgi:hypothetical protein